MAKKFQPLLQQVVTGDCLKVLPKYDAGVFDLVIADPPFNIDFAYDGYEDDLPRDQYIHWTCSWVEAVKRVLHRHASLYVMIGDDYAAEMKTILDCYGFHFRSWIVWSYSFGVYCDAKWGRGHTHILYYTMHPKKFTFNANAVRVPSDRQTKYKDKRANPKGRVPSDVWDFSRVCGTFKERTAHPCQTPLALMERIVLASSSLGDRICDPMAGSGTSLVAAKKHDRRYLGIEQSAKYARIARSRLK